MISPPIAGHHIQWIGSRRRCPRRQYTSAVAAIASSPPTTPATMHSSRTPASRCRCAATCAGNSGPVPEQRTAHDGWRATAATTGTKLRGRHSNSSSSTASITAASGVLKVAAMPAAAPATSSVLRSSARQVQELREQRAHRAAGHDDRPLGAERAAGADRDRRRERLEQRDPRLRPGCRAIRIASIASGMPWPRIFSEP